MKKNQTNNGNSNAKRVLNVALACATVAVALAPLPPVVKGVVFTPSVPAWLRGHIFF